MRWLKMKNNQIFAFDKLSGWFYFHQPYRFDSEIVKIAYILISITFPVFRLCSALKPMTWLSIDASIDEVSTAGFF